MLDPKRLITLDFETYYDQEYSLSAQKYNVSSYVRDPQFQIHCLGVKVADASTEWLLPETIPEFLESVDWKTYAILGHNTAFDGFILSHHYGIIPAFYYDTMGMTRGLHPENTRASLDAIAKFYGLGEKEKEALLKTKGKRVLDEITMLRLGTYCARDVEMTYNVFMTQTRFMPQKELELLDWTIRAFCDPILMVDIERATKARDEEIAEKKALIEACGVPEEDLQSAEKLAEHLRAAGVEPPLKYSTKQGTEIYAFAQTDGEFLDLLEHEEAQVVRLVEARLAVKSTIGETRAQRLIDAGSDGMKLPVLLHYYGAKTGRMSGGNRMNMQNLKRGSELRKSIIAPPGHVVLAVDSGQIEARYNAWLANEVDLVEAFRSGNDLYSEFASLVFGYEVDRKLKEKHPETGEEYAPFEVEGFVGKVCILGLGYQMSGKKLKTTLGLGTMGKVVEMELAECNRMVYAYRNRYTKIVQQWANLEKLLEDLVIGKSGVYADLLEYEPGTYMQPNCVWLPNGMALQYPKLRWNYDRDNDRPRGFIYDTWGGPRTMYGGKLTENIIQALARIDVTDKLVEATKRGHRVASMSHDELIVVTPEREAEQAEKDLVALMATSPTWAPSIPLSAEGKFARYYAK